MKERRWGKVINVLNTFANPSTSDAVARALNFRVAKMWGLLRVILHAPQTKRGAEQCGGRYARRASLVGTS